MSKSTRIRIIQVSLVVFVFFLGFLCGSLSQQNAQAQLKELGKAGLQGVKPGGAAGSVMEMGKSIIEMQEHVDGLQKNLDTLKGIKSALGG